MDRRFSSRDVALSEALAKQKPGSPVPRPRGIRYNSFDDIYKVMSSGTVSQWTSPALGRSFIGTTVLLSIRDSTPPEGAQADLKRLSEVAMEPMVLVLAEAGNAVTDTPIC